MMVNKTLFVIQLHSTVNVITNSSSELFVFEGNDKKSIKSLIEEIYPNYLDEYTDLISIDNLTINELNDFFYFACDPCMWPAKKSDYPILSGFTFDELYEIEDKNPAWNNEVQYKLRNNIINPRNKWDEDFVTEDNFEEIKNKLDPDRKMYFLYSIEENPDWDKQELLMNIGERYHLG